MLQICSNGEELFNLEVRGVDVNGPCLIAAIDVDTVGVYCR